MRTTSIRTLGTATLAAIAALVLSSPASAQADRDGRWMAFVGCWEAVGAEEDLGLLCFDLDDAGVQLTNYVDGEVASTERLVADGSQRTVAVEGCEGWESVEFSDDGRRAFTRTEFFCGTDEARTGTGVMTFVAANRWMDVRVLQVGGEEVAWVQEYRLADRDRLGELGVESPAEGLGMAVRSARMAAAAPIDLADVEEALGRMDAKAVETWIVAQQDELHAGADDLLRLADAGAPGNVIDAVVAVSNPDRFVVEAAGPIEEVADAPRPTHYRGYMGWSPFYGSRWAFGYGMGYGYSPFGYRYSPWGFGYTPGYGYGYWGSRPGYVIIDRRPRGGTMSNDRGYLPRSGRIPTGRSARPRGDSPSPSFSTGGGSSAGSAAPSSGARRATPRQAKRRGGGDGGL
jgi:hypothetical protein